jgi:hypothetical protein
MILWAWILAAALAPQPSSLGPRTPRALTGFVPVVIHHVNQVMGTEHLPAGRGQPVLPGVFVTLAPDRMQIYDRDAVPLQAGRVVDAAVSSECLSRCPAAFHEAFHAQWLELAVEAVTFNIGIPTRVLFAAHSDLPMKTFLQAAYAAAETRPIQPPALSLLINSQARGLQAIEFHLLPPQGLEVRRGAGAALGMTIAFGEGHYEVSANDPDYVAPRQLNDVKALRSITRSLKKRYPGKLTVVLVPGETVSVRELVDLITVLREDFPRVVLSQGQPLVLP